MILVTVGAQMPFERLVRTVDEWAAGHERNDVFAQIGPTTWRPRHIGWANFLPPEDFRKRVSEAAIVVAHAGMGSIITALELGKPILVMPRRGHLKETRNDHQVATAERFLAQGRIHVAFNEAELVTQLDQLEVLTLQKRDRLSTTASPELIGELRKFIEAS
jgi:UDP-N-acetylglucosamine transferase subunit ALG13